MPSLRRTISSPSVRSSPYPTSLSSASNGGASRIQGHGQRRSSGSETVSRRVLADIEWYRVAEGQRDLEAEQELEERDQNQAHEQLQEVVHEHLGHATFSVAGDDQGVEHLSTHSSPWATYSPGSPELFQLVPTAQFAALSITPHTPTRRHISPESTSSSVESTPQAAEIPLEGLSLGLNLSFSDDDLSALPGLTRTSRSFVTVRAYSFANANDETSGCYAEFPISPISADAPELFN